MSEDSKPDKPGLRKKKIFIAFAIVIAGIVGLIIQYQFPVVIHDPAVDTKNPSPILHTGSPIPPFNVNAKGQTPTPNPTPTSDTSPAGVTWGDEFNGPAGTPPAASKWGADVGGDGWGNGQLEYDTRNANAYLDGQGNLVLEARKENPKNYHCWYGTCKYTSARITTADTYTFTHGRVEARIKLPVGQGMWPAFWLLGVDAGCSSAPDCGEIDIMENVGDEPSIVSATIHGPGYYGKDGIEADKSSNAGSYADGYHVYAVDWSSTRISFSVDGVDYQDIDRATVEAKGRWVFDRPYYIILNVAVGGDWPGTPDDSIFPQRMLVDYVRVYR